MEIIGRIYAAVTERELGELDRGKERRFEELEKESFDAGGVISIEFTRDSSALYLLRQHSLEIIDIFFTRC